MRKPIIAANWKMHKTLKETEEYFTILKPLVDTNEEVEKVVCVPFTALAIAHKATAGTNIHIGAQNMYPEEKGAFTGEVSPSMLLDFKITYVILGHSERREIFGEKNEFIREKLVKAIEVGFIPILCVGETLEEREQDLTESKISKQLEAALIGLESTQIEEIVIAYEPIWAIGTGKTATPADAQNTIEFIRNKVAVLFGQDVAQKIRIQYGGSVKPSNIKELMAQPDIDGALVGGAGLEADSFAQIVNFKESN